MANILDYIDWRGDLLFSASSFNEVDALILSQICYINFDGLLGKSFEDSVPLRELAKKFEAAKDYKKRCKVGAFINDLTIDLFFAAAKSERFGNVGVCGYVSCTDSESVEQFAAMTFLLASKLSFVSFRGTDDTLVGWNEDFNMGILATVPSQKDALEYLTEAVRVLSGKIKVGGHSKGGNLAIFASANIEKKYRHKIEAIYNNDGPGFSEETLKSENFVEVTEKVVSFYPQFSIVGMLFSRAGKYEVVESDEKGLMQHDPFSWHVMATCFKKVGSLDSASRVFHKTFNSWFSALDEQNRRQFVDTVFTVLQSTDARTNTELEKNFFANFTKIVRAMMSLDQDTKTEVGKTMKMLFKIAQKNLPELELFQGSKKKQAAKNKSAKDKSTAPKKADEQKKRGDKEKSSEHKAKAKK